MRRTRNAAIAALLVLSALAGPAMAQPAKPDDKADKAAKPDDKAVKPDDKADKAAKPDDKAAKPDDKAAKPDDKAAGQASGPSAADLEQAKAHFAKGKDLFDKKDFKAAVVEFKESYRLSHNPVLLYNVGFTLDQLGDKSMALFYYQKFVNDAPSDNANVPPARDRITALSKEIEDASLSTGTGTGTSTDTGTGTGTATGTATGTSATGGGTGKGPVTKFQHDPIDSAPPGRPIDVGAFAPEGSDWQVTLFFRAAGEAKFASVEMKPRYNELVGRIPADKTHSPTVQYYIEVRDSNGQIVERAGRSTSPNLIFVEKDAKPHYYADLGDDPSYHEDAKITDAGKYYGSLRGSDDQGGGDTWIDYSGSRFRYLKWGTTGAAVGLVALSATFYLISASAASSLEGDATLSNKDKCPSGPPCRAFSGDQQSLEARGQRFETLANVSLGVGLAGAVAAGVFWYLEARHHAHAEAPTATGANSPTVTSIDAAPVVGRDFLGAAAELRF